MAEGDGGVRLIYMTAGSIAAAEALGQALVAERLAACVNLLPGMRSLYWWDGAVQQDSEVVVIAKTRADLVDRLAARVAELHDYDCPCVVAVPIAGGHGPFLDWIAAQTANATD